MKKNIALFVLIAGFLGACRGEFSDKPPIHPNVNMDFQSKKTAQKYSGDFPEGVVAFGYKTDADDEDREGFIKKDEAVYTGKVNNQFVKKIPVEVNKEFLMKGQKNYNIYCAICHDKVGTGKGMVITRGAGFPPPPQLSDQRIIEMSDGELFNIITHGVRNMPGYATQIEEKTRWAVVGYVRALQISRTASVEDVPKSVGPLN